MIDVTAAPFRHVSHLAEIPLHTVTMNVALLRGEGPRRQSCTGWWIQTHVPRIATSHGNCRPNQYPVSADHRIRIEILLIRITIII